MHVILDWDHTLFDASALKQDLARTLATRGISEQDFFETYQFLVGRNPNRYDYDYHEQVRLLGERYRWSFTQEEQAEDLLRAVMQKGHQYLFPETRAFLKAVKQCAKRVTLLTWGNEEFQKYKIHSSTVAHHFSTIVVTEDKKVEMFHKIFRTDSPEPTFFVSDNLVEIKEIVGRFSAIKPVLKIRDDRREVAEEARDNQIPAFENLMQIHQFLLRRSSASEVE